MRGACHHPWPCEAGLDIVDAKDVCRGEDDSRVLSLAAAAGRIVITDDWGFCEMTVRHSRSTAGVIILSLYALPAGARESYAVARIAELGERAIGNLVIIEPGRVRLRPLEGKQQD